MKYRLLIKTNVVILAIAFSTISTCTFGQQAEVDLYDLSLEELMEIDVYAAANENVVIQETQTKTEVFTQKDFLVMGFNTTQDVLNNITGNQILKYLEDQNLDLASNQNHTILLLIDNKPLQNGDHANFNIDEIIPLEQIDKVEVMGRNSNIIDANNFSSTINIITKQKGKPVIIN